MAFPSNPTPNQVHTEGDIERLWDGKRWLPNLARIIAGSEGDGVPTFLDRGNAGTSITFDVTAATVQQVTLNSASCTFAFTGTPAADTVVENVLRIVHDANAALRAIVWPALSVLRWPNNTLPFLGSTDANSVGYVTVVSYPSGVREAFPGGNFFP